MAAVSKVGTVGPTFRNQPQIARATYDFAVDGGATGALDVFTADGACLVTRVIAVVRTACTSGGSAVLDIGFTGALTGVVNDAAVATLVAEFVISTASPKEMAAGEAIIQTIATAAFTAGKIDYIVEYISL